MEYYALKWFGKERGGQKIRDTIKMIDITKEERMKVFCWS